MIDGVLRRIQNFVGLVDQIRDVDGRLALNRVAVLHLRGFIRSERNLHVLVAQQSLGLDGRPRIRLDDAASGPVDVHHHHHFSIRAIGELDFLHGSFGNSAHAYSGAFHQPGHVVEGGLHMVGGSKHHLRVSDQKDPRRQDGERKCDEQTQAKFS